MANYFAFSRSNYFAVKDREAFSLFCKNLGLVVIEQEPEDKDPNAFTLVGFYNEEGGIPSYDPTTQSDIDFPEELAKHLVDGHVAVVEEIGWEKMRYLVGYAIAVNSKAETREVSLNDIYDAAKDLGAKVTPCEY